MYTRLSESLGTIFVSKLEKLNNTLHETENSRNNNTLTIVLRNIRAN